MFQNLKPVLFSLNEMKDSLQTHAKPEIIEKEINGEIKYIVIEKSAFTSRKDAEIFISLADRFYSMKF